MKVSWVVAVGCGLAAAWTMVEARGQVMVAAIDHRADQQTLTPGNEIATRYLKVRLGLVDKIAAPGARVTLLADVTPGPKMHVYAPGQQGYISIAIEIAPSSDFKAAPAQFPASEPYFFAPTNETSQVYNKPFQIAQDVTIAATAALRKRAAAKETLTIAGTLKYQACDDLVCYRPDSVPVSWKIELVPVGRGFSPGNVAGPEGPAYTRWARQSTQKPE
jgi:DsbC/DsbD-like thiol-disulfide interchange protein